MVSIDYYWGAASGSSRKALRQLEEPNVMISYATQKNKPWSGIDRLFVDCGGYSMLKAGTDLPDPAEYADHLREVDPYLWALPDYPCEPDLLDDRGETVQSHQEKTTEAHKAMADRSVPGQPLSVVQGWDTTEYVAHLNALDDAGVLFDHVGIGSVCRRHAVAEIADVVSAVRSALGENYHIHGFGVKTSVLNHPKAIRCLDSADTLSYEYRERYGSDIHQGPKWKRVAYHYLTMKLEIWEATADDQAQTTLPAAGEGQP